MHAEKLRNTTPEELRHQEQELSDQLFRLRFQLKMGQSESLKKLRDLRKDIARVKTILRERELGIVVNPQAAPSKAAAPVADSASEVEEKAQKAPVKAAAAKKPAAHSKAKSAGKSSAGKKKSEKK